MGFEDEVFIAEEENLMSEIDYIIEETENAVDDICFGDSEDEGDIIDLVADDTTEIGEDENNYDFSLLNDSEEECCGNEFEIDPTEDCIGIDDGLYEESVDKFTVETVINYEENSEEGDI